MLWGRKTVSVHERARAVGLDLNASRVRGVAVAAGKARGLLLDAPEVELHLFVALDRRPPEVGRAGYAACRLAPHTVCSNFLPALTRNREWRAGRTAVTAEAALELMLNALRGPVAAETEAAAVALPTYLAPAQVTKIVATATRAKFPIKGTAVAALAVVADRAGSVLAGRPVAPEVPAPEWVVPLRPAATGPGAVAVIDADEHALTAALVTVERDRARLLASNFWPRLALKGWKDRLLDAVSDRCVRLCRRDPRDSAVAEQALFEQLDDALDRVRDGQRVNFPVRTDHWFQDVVQQPDELEAACAGLARAAGEGVKELLAAAGLPAPPRAVWLTHAAGRLPGLARAVHQSTPEGTAVEVLPPDAVALAAAALVPRWLAAELPRAHLDAVIPLPAATSASADKPAGTGRR